MSRRRRQRDLPDSPPTSLGDALSDVSAELGLPEPGLVASLGDRWSDVVGPTVAEHARPRSLRDGILTIAVDAPAWATQLRYLEREICARLTVISGRATVRSVRVVVDSPR